MVTQQEISADISKAQLQSMARIVERALTRSIESLIYFDVVLARNVIEEDKVVNGFEIAIDNSTFGILAVSKDMSPDLLRSILSIQKINPMLERIGDHAVNIAESAEILSSRVKNGNLFQIKLMADQCESILHDALKSFFEKDLTLAEDVLRRDDEIDRLNVSIGAEVKSSVLNDLEISFETAMEIIRISRNLERIADLSSNIAEETMFSTSGRVVKHHSLFEQPIM
jgi:phosphate transport system protein